MKRYKIVLYFMLIPSVIGNVLLLFCFDHKTDTVAAIYNQQQAYHKECNKISITLDTVKINTKTADGVDTVVSRIYGKVMWDDGFVSVKVDDGGCHIVVQQCRLIPSK